jgi:hypothetical protein
MKFNFAIFKSKQKKSDKSPDYTSTIKVEEFTTFEPDKEYQLAGWIKESKSGIKYISVLVTEKKDFKSEKKTDSFDDFGTVADDSDIPF